MSQCRFFCKKGKPLYGVASRNTMAYAEGNYALQFYSTERGQEKAASRYRKFMEEVITFEVDILAAIEANRR